MNEWYIAFYKRAAEKKLKIHEMQIIKEKLRAENTGKININSEKERLKVKVIQIG